MLDSYNRNNCPPEILFLGDSTVERVSRYDEDKRSTPEVLNDMIKDSDVVGISHSAYTMNHYYHLIKLFGVLRDKPKTVIIPVNMRSFSPSWYERPQFQFNRQIEILNDYYKNKERRRSYFLKQDKPSEQDLKAFFELSVDYPLTNFNLIKQFEECINNKTDISLEQKEKRRALIFTYYYLHRLSSQNPIILKMIQLLKLLNRLNVPYVFYITPINYQAAIRYVGNIFLEYFSQNINILSEILQNHQCQYMKYGQDTIKNQTPGYCLDFSRQLSGNYFFHRDELTEHVNIEGKKYIASNIARFISDIIKL
jgi:hypothetical protein